MKVLDIILAHIFVNYTKRVYHKGYMDGFNWKR